LHTTNVKK